MGGRKLYVLTSPEDVSKVYRNNTTVSWDVMLNELLVAFGVRASVIPKLWLKPAVGAIRKERGDVPHEKISGSSVIHSTLDLYKRQLLPGEKLDMFSGKLLGCLGESLHWGKLSTRYGPPCSGWIMKVSLQDLCGEVLVDAITRTFFGDRIYDTEPEMIQNLLDFNDDAWMLIFHYPQKKGSKLHKARQKLLGAFVTYIQSPEEMRAGRAWLIEEVMEEHKTIDISNEDKAALLLMIYWA